MEHHIHESPRSMTIPLIVLAFFSMFAGFLGWPHSLGGSNRFEAFLEPVFAKEAHVLRVEGKAAQLAAGKKEEEHTDPMEYGLMFLVSRGGGCRLGLRLASLPQCRPGLRRADRRQRSSRL